MLLYLGHQVLYLACSQGTNSGWEQARYFRAKHIRVSRCILITFSLCLWDYLSCRRRKKLELLGRPYIIFVSSVMNLEGINSDKLWAKM
jgi:hypothetical protein